MTYSAGSSRERLDSSGGMMKMRSNSGVGMTTISECVGELQASLNIIEANPATTTSSANQVRV